ncbi:MAG: hypothetical protein US13_C0001G0085 [candidate division TM6 bacterium GW2011_GWE2_36_25]|nr:MAG: hypothetical protein US03_C0001G0119 [candidate division TM6 bacterium GW2011_GWF2_36_131]KKQ03745.1 MAG: hypothetical protein US13_C0001G0085 [candidate division TM6 bacterium GW2011_GWE2_36_25]KKQ19889.1 MAG: hypothetical protein US32_C0003G0006 [candidate division TM6 bacterium GW2011_GWA2_36_9]
MEQKTRPSLHSQKKESHDSRYCGSGEDLVCRVFTLSQFISLIPAPVGMPLWISCLIGTACWAEETKDEDQRVRSCLVNSYLNITEPPKEKEN